eukprot:TRINITY_DN5206_c0_g1_i2.p1 TRINITY_DN5206_c0_g1~~TRINITY_DN5206_c0_g1_i2.p1  ORF type:complete len:272 (+),score=49.35 TRINITY_DN5206_c0_g1_i2:135-950(+)
MGLVASRSCCSESAEDDDDDDEVGVDQDAVICDTESSPEAGLERVAEQRMKEHKIHPLPALTSKNPSARIRTSEGNFLVQLFVESMPIAVSNFVYLARSGFYNGTRFHRVQKNFIQGGCPNTKDGSELKPGKGKAPPKSKFKNLKNGASIKRDSKGCITDEWGYNESGEFRTKSKISNLAGTISMASRGRANSCSCQFLVNATDNYDHDWWNPTHKKEDRWGYPVFGIVTEGMDVIRKISHLKPHESIDEKSKAQAVYVFSVTIYGTNLQD